jgi:CRISPR-associated endonuclease Csn1
MGYRIGLDIGITSIGWATIEMVDGVKQRIGGIGVRIFDKPENPKDGSSLALPRREARSMRRRLRRQKHRIQRIKNLIEQLGIMTTEQIAEMYSNSTNLVDVYRLRYEALDRQLKKDEFVRVLIHIAQRRGFKSNRRSELSEKGSESGKLLSAVNDNAEIMDKKGYRTIGEMLYLDERFSINKRNKGEDYSHTVSRELLKDEICQIFKAQRAFGNENANYELERLYTEIFLSQRSFAQGPGGNSPYKGGESQIEKMIGFCTFEPEEKRAVKASYSFERFMLLSKVNSLRIRKTGEGTRQLSNIERAKIIEHAYQVKDLRYSKLRKILSMAPDEGFNGLGYGRKTQDEVEKAIFVSLTSFHKIKSALDSYEKNYIGKMPVDQLDEIGYILTVFKDDLVISEKLSAIGLNSEIIKRLLPLSFEKTGHLSIKAIKNILPYLEEGLDYDKACFNAGYDFRGHSGTVKGCKLPAMDFEQITNPVVKRALSQSVKVINAIISCYGQPEGINIELAREMSKNFKERKDTEKLMDQNHSHNQKIRERLINEFGITNPRGEDIVKLKLFEEQDGWCLYSGEKLDVTRIFTDPGYADVDHIIPYSKCFNDSYTNKVLVSGKENRQKGNLLPMEYLMMQPKKLEKFIALVNSLKLPYMKKQYLLKKSICIDEEEDFKDRNLNDTRYITKALANHIRDYLKFADSPNNKSKRVVCVNGSVTSYMRKRWRLTKIRENGDLHHALDAAVIACIDDGIINRVSNYHKQRELFFMGNAVKIDSLSGEIISRSDYDDKMFLRDIQKFPLPWPEFRNELESRLLPDPETAIRRMKLTTYPIDEIIKPIFVSRAPRHKSNGQGHLETIRSPKLIDEGYSISKTPLTSLKYKNGAIEGYYNPESDVLLYNALCNRLKEYNGNAKEAFSTPFYKPTSNNEQGPLVKKVKIMTKSTLGVFVNKGRGYADNGSMIRIDIFYKNGNYFFIPIYASDTVKTELPNRAVVANKRHQDWVTVDNTYRFLFTLYPNDLIRFEHKSGISVSHANGESKTVKDGFMYYVKASISSASITVTSHDRSCTIPSLGIKTLLKLEKWQVDYLGNIQEVKSEKRLSYNNRRRCD